MSYDIYLTINTGKNSHIVKEVGNYTSNIGPMFRKAFGNKDWKYISEMKAKDALPDIKKACERMASNPAEYKELEPSNGWGNYQGALKYLQDLLEGAEEHPETIIKISY